MLQIIAADYSFNVLDSRFCAVAESFFRFLVSWTEDRLCFQDF